MIYLASAYSHRDRMIEAQRYDMARVFAQQAISRGHAIFSPIAYCHPNFDLGTEAHHWQSFNDAMLLASKELWVLVFPGWITSTGVTYEIELALAHSIPVRYFFEGGIEWL